MNASSRKHQEFVIHCGILLISFLIPLWLRLPNAPKSFSREYALGFVWILPVMATVAIWVASGFIGVEHIAKHRRKALFAFAVLGMALWANASVQWAFIRHSRPDVTVGVAGQMGLAALFAVMVLACPPPPKWVTLAFILGLLAHGSIGAVQVALQQDIGLRFLGEYRLDPLEGGISVVQSGDIRWLRPYGLSAHPNPYAGYLAVGVLCAGAWVLAWLLGHNQHTTSPIAPRHRNMAILLVSLLTLCFGMWMLGLTFSRGAWLGVAIGGVAMLLVTLLRRLWTRHRLWWGAGIGFLLIALMVFFFISYYFFMLARAGLTVEYVETRAVNERAIHVTIAYAIFEDAPVLGVGAGNFPWYASYHLQRVMRINMKGDNIHNVYLSALAELGIIGLFLLLAGLVVALIHPPKNPYRLGLWGAGLALVVVGIFDHYTWSMVMHNAMWWAILALAIESSERSIHAHTDHVFIRTQSQHRLS